MRRPALSALVTAVVILLGATTVLFVKYRKTSADYADMKVAEESARSNYTEAFNAIAEIQDSLNAITLEEGTVRLRPQGLQAEQKLSQPNQREALESIALLNASIQRTRQKISQLEASLKRSGVKVAGLERMVTNLKHSVAEKQEQVAALTTQVDSLHTQVAGLETTVQQDRETILANQEVIEEKRRELGTIYYIIGTKKDLAASGIIVAKGGVLGLGKTLQLSGRFDESRFTALDTDQETVVRAAAAKVKVLSPQPTSSYELRPEGKEVELHILDPKEFRKVKHLVIVTA
jgi:predicted  nucleic acid-binding Zn-ribbon protein